MAESCPCSGCGEGRRCPGVRGLDLGRLSAFPAPRQRGRRAGTEPRLVEMIAGQFLANNHPYCCVCYKLGCSTVMFSGLIMFAFGLS